jgi:hypothetical protein
MGFVLPEPVLDSRTITLYRCLTAAHSVKRLKAHLKQQMRSIILQLELFHQAIPPDLRFF